MLILYMELFWREGKGSKARHLAQATLQKFPGDEDVIQRFAGCEEVNFGKAYKCFLFFYPPFTQDHGVPAVWRDWQPLNHALKRGLNFFLHHTAS